MIKAHLPSGIEWFTEISTLPDDQSVYSWYAHNDLVYLAVDRDDELAAQTDFLSLRWRKHVPMTAFWKKFKAFRDEFDRVTEGDNMSSSEKHKYWAVQFQVRHRQISPHMPGEGGSH